MCGLELLTAARERSPLPVLVFNDGRYGLIRLDQLRQHGQTFGVDLPAFDLAGLATATGASYASAGYLGDDDIATVVRRALETPGPTVIDVPVGDSAAMRRARVSAQVRGAGRKLLGRRLVEWLKRLR